MSDADMAFSYCLLDTPVPLLNYVAHVRLAPVTDGDRTFWHWESRFDTPPGRESRNWKRMVGTEIYEGGFGPCAPSWDWRGRNDGAGRELRHIGRGGPRARVGCAVSGRRDAGDARRERRGPGAGPHRAHLDPVLSEVRTSGDGVTIGAGVTMAQVIGA
jgi:hypothetical protein